MKPNGAWDKCDLKAGPLLSAHDWARGDGPLAEPGFSFLIPLVCGGEGRQTAIEKLPSAKNDPIECMYVIFL